MVPEEIEISADIAQMTATQLRKECQKHKIHYSMLLSMFDLSNIISGGDKEALVRWLRKLKNAQQHPETVTEKLEAFLGTPGQCEAGTVPVITQHYRNTFNATDRFDCYLGHIPYDIRIPSINHLCLISVLRMTLVNAYTLFCTIQQAQVDDKSEGISDFVKVVETNLL